MCACVCVFVACVFVVAVQWPAALSTLLRLVLPVIDMSFLGRLGTEKLAAAGVATIWMSMSSTFLWMSCGGAVNTLCAQVRLVAVVV